MNIKPNEFGTKIADKIEIIKNNPWSLASYLI